MAEYLLNKGANVNHQRPDGSTPIFNASFHGLKKMVQLLLKYGANPSRGRSDSNPLFVAAQNGHFEVARLLIEAGCVINDTENTPLAAACYKRNIPIIKLLLEAGGKNNVLFMSFNNI